MIVPMRRIHLAARQRDRARLLEELRELGVLHLVPVDPATALADEQTTRLLQSIERALQLLSGVAAHAPTPDLGPQEAACEVLEIERRAAAGRSRLATLHHQLEQIDMWGKLRLADVQEVRAAGIDLRFYSLSAKAVGAIDAECAEVVGQLPGRQVLVAVADRSGSACPPAEAVEVPLPSHDAFTLRAEAAALDVAHHEDLKRLHQLAGLAPQLRAELTRLREQADYTIASGGGVTSEDLFAMQGWLPAEAASDLHAQLARRGVSAAVQVLQPEPDQQPPTLTRVPAWARPIEALFKMLGTLPGYREFDVSIPFLLALPIFTALLISDGGYGALLLLGPLLAYRFVARKIGAQFTQLLMLIGAVSLLWGIVTGTFFGFTPYPPLIPVDLSEGSREIMMRISFTLGAVHLSLAQLWKSVHIWPNIRCLNGVGWALFIWGMYGVVNMFVLHGPLGWETPWPYFLLTGAVLAIVFASPSRNPARMLALGLAQFPLSMLSAFSDVISYVRLMAVGLASSVLAVSFNDMALNASSVWLTVAVLVLGHSLNMGLALIAMFAHGVRLNMLEFSGNLGMQWTGFPYQPFTRRSIQEPTQC